MNSRRLDADTSGCVARWGNGNGGGVWGDCPDGLLDYSGSHPPHKHKHNTGGEMISDNRFYHVGGPTDAITHTYREPPACPACNNHSKVHNHDQPGDDPDRGQFLPFIFWAGVVVFAIILIAMWIIP